MNSKVTFTWRKSRHSDDKGGACVELAGLTAMTSIGTCRAPDRTEDHGMANDLGWRKARRSNDHGGACVELAALTEGVGVRDSKNPDGPKLVLTLTTFRTLLTDLKQQ